MLLKKFTFYWGDGTREVRTAESQSAALANSPFMNDQHEPLIFVKEGDDNTYTWRDGYWQTTNLLKGDSR